MKVQGFEGTLQGRSTFVIDRGGKRLALELKALPFGYEQELEKMIPTPSPPRKGWMREKSGRLSRDATGKPIPEYDYDDPDYKQARMKAVYDQMILTVVQALAGDPRIEFEARRADFDTAQEYVDAVRKELSDFGFTTMDIVNISREVMKISGATEEELRAVRPDFSLNER